MRVLIFLVPLIAVATAFYFIGRASVRTSGPKLSRPEKQELALLRSFKTAARRHASTHQLVEGSPLAQQILDEIDQTETEIDNVRAS